MQVLLLGYYGYRNIGDDLFVENLLNYLEPVSSKIRVICNEDYYTHRFGGKKNIEFLCAENLSKVSRLLATINSDFIFWGGGTLQIDQEPKSLLATQTITKLLRKKFGFLGVGLEGANLESAQIGASVKNLFSNSNFLYLRDSDSYTFANKELQASSNAISLGGDLAFLKLDWYKPFIRESKGPDIQNVSFTGKHWWGEGRAEFYAKPLLQLIEKYNTQIHLLPGSMNAEQGDNAFHERLKVFLPQENCTLHTWESPEDFLGILGQMDFHIGNRLHSIITADILGVPNIGISSDPPKIRSYICKTALLEQERVVEFMEEISIDRIDTVSKGYKRPVEFIEQESAKAQQCLGAIFGPGK